MPIHPPTLKTRVLIIFSLFLLAPASSVFASPTVTIPASPVWVPSGSPGTVTHYANYGPSTYYVRAWTYDSAGNWSAVPSAPFLVTLTALPNAPTLSGMWQGSTYVGTTTVPAYSANGYQLYAMATSSASSDRFTYYFEWAATPTAFTGYSTEFTQTPTAPGIWSDITHFLNGNNLPGTYYVRAWTKDQNGSFSHTPSAILPVTLVVPPIQATCSPTPSSAYTGATVTWNVSSPTGGDGAYAYSWTGTDGIAGAGTFVPKQYATGGTKTASVTVSSAGISKTIECGAATISVIPDLTTTGITVPLSGVSNQSVAFSGIVSNIGTGPAANFPNVFQIYDSTLTNQIDRVSAGTISSLAVGANATVSSTYTFMAAGTYSVRVCANIDTAGNLVVNESNTNNNCSGWQSITITHPPLAASCAVAPSTGTTLTPYLWSASGVTGGDGTYIYSWTGTDGLTGSGATASSTYATSGTKTAALTVTSAGGSMIKTVPCTNAVTVLPPPAITVNPTAYIATLPSSTISALYTLTNASFVDTTCRLLNNAFTPLTAYAPCNGAQSVTAPAVVGTYGYYLQAKKTTTGEVATSNSFIVIVNNPLVATGTLTTPASCTISAGSSTCTVSASWSTTNATGAYLFDGNVNQTLYTGNSSTGSTVWVANPQTVFILKNGNGISLATKTVTASCAAGSTWSGSACLANVAIGSFTPTAPSIAFNGSTALNWSGVTGGGTVTCSIDNGVGAATPAASGSKSSGTLALTTTFTLTCGNGVGPNATKATTVTVGSAPVNGVCSATHYSCTTGTSASNVNGTSAYTWSCTGLNGGTTASCSEAKAAPTATLTAIPASVAFNGQATLTWASTNATTCTAGGPWLNNPALAGSGLTNPLTAATTFTFQCTGNGQTTPLQSVTVSVGSAPVNGVCSATHYSCTTGTSASNVNGTSAYTWSCTGLNGGTTASCSEAKAASGTLTMTPTSCVIAKGASTCTVEASWDLANTSNAYLFDANPHGSGIIYGQGIGAIPLIIPNGYIPNGHTDPIVYAAYPSTNYTLNNGDGTVLSSSTVTTSCAAGSTWDGSVCLADAAIGSFSANPSTIASGDTTILSWSGVTGGGTVTCSIDNGVGAATPAASGSKSSGTLALTTTFTLTCSNGVGPNATKSTAVTVGAAPAATGTLTTPASCTIASGASTCTVSAAWSTTNATGAYLLDRNVGATLYTANSSPGSTVWVANPQTVFDLKNGNGTLLDTKTVTTSCATGSAWDGSICAANVYSCTALPAHANAFAAPDNTGLSSNTPYMFSSSDTLAKCEFNCTNGYNWNGTSCVPNSLSVSCTGAPGNPYIAQPVTWASSVSGGSGSYTRVWSGDETLSGAGTSVQKSYATAGIKNASVTITDSVSGGTGSANCATGAAQPNGPPVSSTGGYGVSVGACVIALTANPYTLVQGDSSTLSWSVTGGSVCASSCVSGSVDFDTGGRISGTAIVTPPAGTPSYALTCQPGTYGPPPPANVTLTVRTLAPTVTINGQTTGSGSEGGPAPGAVVVDPTVPTNVDNITLEWTPPNNVCTAISTCSITKNGDQSWRTNLACSGTVTDRITTQTTYIVDCIKTNNTHTTQTVIVNVLLNYQEF